jgi:hypothetical protein
MMPAGSVQLPRRGMSASEVLAQTLALRDTDPYTAASAAGDGLKKWGGIYHMTSREGEGGAELEELQSAVTTQFNSTNALYPGLWPSLQKFESEIVAMTLALLDSPPTAADGGGGAAVGLLTSGGTESILLPVLGYREWARVHKPPEAVAAPEVRLSAI